MRGDGAFVMSVSGDDFPVDDFGFCTFAVADHYAPLLWVPCEKIGEVDGEEVRGCTSE